MPKKVEWGEHLWDVDPDTDCWVWNHTLTKYGYGQYGRCKKAHREAYEREHSKNLTPEEKVRHSCDNPPCVNPSHLILGTQAENIKDMMDRKRAWHSNYSRCIHGHELVPGNIYIRTESGKPRCRKCALAAVQRYKERKKARA